MASSKTLPSPSPQSILLLRACALGDYEAALAALDNGASLLAAMKGISADKEAEHRDSAFNPIMLAAAHGHHRLLRALIQRASLAHGDPFSIETIGTGLRALDLACFYTHPECAALLAPATPAIAPRSTLRREPAAFIAIGGHWPHAPTERNRATLAALIGTAHLAPELFEGFQNPLIRASALCHLGMARDMLPHFDPTLADSETGRTAFINAAASQSDGAPACLALLLPSIDPDSLTSQGWSALAFAASDGRPESVEFLLRLNPDPAQILLSLHAACSHGREEAVRLLAEKCDPLAFYSSHSAEIPYTALMAAASEGHAPCCRALIPYGGAGLADPRQRRTAADLALANGYGALAEELQAAHEVELLASSIPRPRSERKPCL